MNYRMKLITAPAAEPLLAADVKLYAHISHSVEDGIITGWIKYAREQVEQFWKRALITQTWEVTFDKFPVVPFNLPRPPLQSVTSIKYYDVDNTEYEFAASNYFVDTDHEPGRINLEHGISWPAVTLRDINGLKIRFVAGYGDAATDVPQAAKEAITLYCAYRNENRIGETEVPKAFYDILRPDRVYYQ